MSQKEPTELVSVHNHLVVEKTMMSVNITLINFLNSTSSEMSKKHARNWKTNAKNASSRLPKKRKDKSNDDIYLIDL